MRFVGSPLRQLFFQFRAHGLPVEMQIALPFKSSKPLALRERYLKIAPLSTESPIVTTVAELSATPIRTQARQQKPTFRIRPTTGWAALNVRELWKYRDLLWILVERDTKLLYKQTALGVAWVVMQPLIAAIIFTVVFGRVARLPSDGAPYLLFVFCGLTVWTYFSQALRRAGNSISGSPQLISKVYFPRLLIPLAHTVGALVDFAVILVMLFILMWIYRVPPTFRLAIIPVILLLMAFTAT